MKFRNPKRAVVHVVVDDDDVGVARDATEVGEGPELRSGRKGKRGFSRLAVGVHTCLPHRHGKG